MSKETDNLIAQKAEHRRMKFLRAWFNGKLTRRNRPKNSFYRLSEKQ